MIIKKELGKYIIHPFNKSIDYNLEHENKRWLSYTDRKIQEGVRLMIKISFFPLISLINSLLNLSFNYLSI